MWWHHVMSLKHALTWFVYLCTNIVNVNITWQQTYRGLIWRFWRVCLHKSSSRQFFSGLVQYFTTQKHEHSDTVPTEHNFTCACVNHVVRDWAIPRNGSRKWHAPTKSRSERDSLAQPIFVDLRRLTNKSDYTSKWRLYNSSLSTTQWSNLKQNMFNLIHQRWKPLGWNTFCLICFIEL